jgi:hypothetical protein
MKVGPAKVWNARFITKHFENLSVKLIKFLIM